VRAPKGVHRQSNTEQSADRGHDNVTGHKRRPAHSLKKRKHCHEFYSDSLDGCRYQAFTRFEPQSGILSEMAMFRQLAHVNSYNRLERRDFTG
jgi:hypothetical protein